MASGLCGFISLSFSLSALWVWTGRIPVCVVCIYCHSVEDSSVCAVVAVQQLAVRLLKLRFPFSSDCQWTSHDWSKLSEVLVFSSFWLVDFVVTVFSGPVWVGSAVGLTFYSQKRVVLFLFFSFAWVLVFSSLSFAWNCVSENAPTNVTLNSTESETKRLFHLEGWARSFSLIGLLPVHHISSLQLGVGEVSAPQLLWSAETRTAGDTTAPREELFTKSSTCRRVSAPWQVGEEILDFRLNAVW